MDSTSGVSNNKMMIRNSVTGKCYFVEVSSTKEFVLTEVEQIDHSHIKDFYQIDYTDTVFIYDDKKILNMNIDRKLLKIMNVDFILMNYTCIIQIQSVVIISFTDILLKMAE